MRRDRWCAGWTAAPVKSYPGAEVDKFFLYSKAKRSRAQGREDSKGTGYPTGHVDRGGDRRLKDRD